MTIGPEMTGEIQILITEEDLEPPIRNDEIHIVSLDANHSEFFIRDELFIHPLNTITLNDDCSKCINCLDCTNCHNCVNCIDCVDCNSCDSCVRCTGCVDCFKCKDSHDLTDLRYTDFTYGKALPKELLRGSRI
jgi:hypothetical protein